MKDNRDPQELGKLYLELREAGLPIERAVQMPCEDYDTDELGPLEKYGDPREVA